MFGGPGFVTLGVADYAVAASRIGAEGELPVIGRVAGDAEKPIRQGFARAHTAEIVERLSGVERETFLNEGLQLLECQFQVLETADEVFHQTTGFPP